MIELSRDTNEYVIVYGILQRISRGILNNNGRVVCANETFNELLVDGANSNGCLSKHSHNSYPRLSIMGTRGFLAFIYKGKLYVMYNQLDCYPEPPGLGWTVVQEILWANLEKWKAALDNIKVADGKPTEEDIKALRPYTDLQVSSQSTDDWYCLTRKCQGSALRILQSGYFYGSVYSLSDVKNISDYFTQDWAYLIDFDKNEFRTFQGRQEVEFWRFPLEAIPENLFERESIETFNKWAKGE